VYEYAEVSSNDCADPAIDIDSLGNFVDSQVQAQSGTLSTLESLKRKIESVVDKPSGLTDITRSIQDITDALYIILSL